MLAVGSLIIVPLLAFMATGLIATQVVEERMYELYTADAGVEDAIHKIMKNNASLPQIVGDTWPYSISDVNGKTADVEIWLEEDIERFLEGLLNKDAGVHDEWAVIAGVLAPGIYEITITYSPPPPGHENKKVNGVGAWLHGGYQYVLDSAMGMTDDYPVFNFRTESYKGGTAFIWEWQGNDRPEFGEQTGVYTMTQTFEFTPANIPDFYLSWFVAGSDDIGLVVGAATFGIWRITATVDSDTGVPTKVVAYVSNFGDGVTSVVDILTWEINPEE